MKEKSENLEAVLLDIEIQVNTHEQKLSKLQKFVKDFENYDRGCGCDNVTMDNRMQRPHIDISMDDAKSRSF